MVRALLTSGSAQIQRNLLHDRHLPSEHHVFQALLPEHPGNRVLEARGKLLFGKQIAFWLDAAEQGSLITLHFIA